MDLGKTLTVAGFGATTTASADDLRAALAALPRFDLIATLDRAHLKRLAAMLKPDVRIVAVEDALAAAPRAVTRAGRPDRELGAMSLAECVALALAGPEAQLLMPRRVHGRITLALAGERQ